jgi:hypothetical protein
VSSFLHNSPLSAGTLPPLLTVVSWLLFLGLSTISGRQQDGSHTRRRRNMVRDIMVSSNNSDEDVKRVLEENLSNPEDINLALLQLQNLGLNRSERREHNKTIVKCLTEIHESRTKALIWMKQHIYPSTCKAVLDDEHEENCIDKVQDKIQKTGGKVQDKFRSLKQAMCTTSDDPGKINWSAVAKRFVMVSVSYLDLIKDTILLATLVYLLQDTLFTDFTAFPSQLTWVLLMSVVIPLLTSALETAHSRPLLILGFSTWEQCRKTPLSRSKLLIIKIVTIVCYPLVPGILIMAQEEANRRLEELLTEVKEEAMEEIQELYKYREQVTTAMLSFKRNEFGVEMILQLTIQNVMLLLSKTVSPTHSGLEAVFKEDSEKTWLGFDFTQVFLVLSVLWSFMSFGRTYIKIKTEEKTDFLPVTAKLLLGFRAILASVTRIGCIVAFYCPVLGLLGLLSHWTAEQVSFDPKYRDDDSTVNMTTDLLHYWDLVTGHPQSVAYSVLYRSDYTDPAHPVPPVYTMYTGGTLGAHFGVFWVLLLLQSVAVYLVKMKLSHKFREVGWIKKIHHTIEVLNLPDSFADWDECEGSPGEHKERWRGVLRETVFMSMVHFFSSLMMLVPIIFTGRNSNNSYSASLIRPLSGVKIRERHNTILPVIGAFEQEKEAFILVTQLSWALPLALLLSTMLDLLLVWTYMKFGHPWGEILTQEESKGEMMKELVETGKKPVETEKKPVETGKKPVETAKMPVETGKKPVETEKKPVETEKEPVERVVTVQES